MRAAAVTRAILVTAIIGVSAAACGSTDDSAVTYRPAAYYQAVAGVDECYYVDDTTEAVNLIAAGLCPRGSIAVRMPLTWEEEYWAYYSSPSYINTYIPSAQRTHFTTVTVVTFSTKYKTQISSLSSKAIYKGSNGSTATGSSVRKFTGSGSGTGTVHGGGSARGCAGTMQELANKSSGSSSTHGGGSARTGSSSSKSGTSSSKTGSKTSSGSNGAC